MINLHLFPLARDRSNRLSKYSIYSDALPGKGRPHPVLDPRNYFRRDFIWISLPKPIGLIATILFFIWSQLVVCNLVRVICNLIRTSEHPSPAALLSYVGRNGQPAVCADDQVSTLILHGGPLGDKSVNISDTLAHFLLSLPNPRAYWFSGAPAFSLANFKVWTTCLAYLTFYLNNSVSPDNLAGEPTQFCVQTVGVATVWPGDGGAVCGDIILVMDRLPSIWLNNEIASFNLGRAQTKSHRVHWRNLSSNISVLFIAIWQYNSNCIIWMKDFNPLGFANRCLFLNTWYPKSHASYLASKDYEGCCRWIFGFVSLFEVHLLKSSLKSPVFWCGYKLLHLKFAHTNGVSVSFCCRF